MGRSCSHQVSPRVSQPWHYINILGETIPCCWGLRCTLLVARQYPRPLVTRFQQHPQPICDNQYLQTLPNVHQKLTKINPSENHWIIPRFSKSPSTSSQNRTDFNWFEGVGNTGLFFGWECARACWAPVQQDQDLRLKGLAILVYRECDTYNVKSIPTCSNEDPKYNK